LHTTWKASFAHLMWGVSAALGVLIAIGLTGSGSPGWFAAAAWLLVSTLAAGGTASWLHFREGERLRRSLAAGLTHHLRTSLAHVRSFNEMLLLEQESSREQRREWLEVVGREAERLATAVENVLLLVSDSRSVAYPVRRQVDLGELLEDAAAAVAIDSPGMRFEIAPAPGVIVEGSPEALRHALTNLLDSVVHSSQPGALIAARLERVGRTALLEVLAGSRSTDDPGNLPRPRFAAPQPFPADPLKLESSARFGLEVAVAQHIAHLHGGRTLTVARDGRHGFQLELPAS
jgi:signal transduction histidine kinase